jgi:dipeptide transport system substrate-binding protein
VFTLFTRNGGGPTNPNPMLGAQMMQADLAKVGIKIDIRVMEWGEMLKRAKGGEHDMVSAGWAGDNGDPDNFLTPMLSCEAAKTAKTTRAGATKFQALIPAPANPPSARLYEQAQVVLIRTNRGSAWPHPNVYRNAQQRRGLSHQPADHE